MSARPITQRLPVAPRQSIVVTSPRSRVGHWVLFVIFVLVAFFGLIYSRISLDRSAFEITELESQIFAEQEAQSVLELELARLQDPQRVAEAAARLGLVYPEDRNPLSVQRVDVRLTDVDYRWAQLGGGVRAQP